MKPIRPNRDGEFPKLDDGVHEVALGNMTQFTVLLLYDLATEALWVGVKGKGCYPFSNSPHPAYVGEKLGIPNRSDQNNLADFIGDQISPNPIRFGAYDYPNLLAKMPPEPCGDCDPCCGGRPDQCAISPNRQTPL